MKTTYRRPKSVTTRPGSDDAWGVMAANNARRANEHDRAIADYGIPLLRVLAEDLGKRFAHDRKDPEQRWVMDRKAAVLRRLCNIQPTYPSR